MTPEEDVRENLEQALQRVFPELAVLVELSDDRRLINFKLDDPTTLETIYEQRNRPMGSLMDPQEIGYLVTVLKEHLGDLGAGPT